MSYYQTKKIDRKGSGKQRKGERAGRSNQAGNERDQTKHFPALASTDMPRASPMEH